MGENETHEIDSHQVVDLFDRKPVRVGLFVVVPAVVFLLVCAGIRVSQYGIDHTIVVLGQDRLQAGSPAALRVTLIADGSGFFLPDRLAGHLVRGDERFLLFDGAVNDAGYALARNFTVPDMEPGPAVLEIDVRFDERRRIVRSDVQILSTSPKQKLFVPDDVKPDQVPIQLNSDGHIVQVYSEDRGAPTGFTSVLFFRTLDQDGAPVRSQLKLAFPKPDSVTETAIEERRTDQVGLLAIPVKPFDLEFPIELLGTEHVADSGDPENDGGVAMPVRKKYLFPKIVYGGIYAAVHNPILSIDEPIRLGAQQLSRGGPLYVDLFQDGRWVQAASAWVSGDGSVKMDVRSPVEGLVRLQVTNSALSAGKTIAVRHVYVTPRDQDLNHGLRAILRLLKDKDEEWTRAVSSMELERGGDFDRGKLAAYCLSRLYEGHQIVPRIVSSRKNDDLELGTFKAGFQRSVMIVIILLGLAVAMIIGMIARQAQKRQARITMMIMADDMGEDEAGRDRLLHEEERSIRRRMIFQGAVLVVIVVGAFASIALLVDVMKWGG